jgi:hypothetical protein
VQSWAVMMLIIRHYIEHPDGSKITFDQRIKTRDGWVGGVDVMPIIITMWQSYLKMKQRASLYQVICKREGH